MSPRSVPLFELENLFDGFAEDPGDLQCQYRRGDEAPGLDGVYGLAAYADGNCCWVMRTSARSTRILFFICDRVFQAPQFPAEYREEYQQHGEQVVDHDVEETEVVGA